MVTCAKCGARVVGDSAFCVKCGLRLKPAQEPPGSIYCGRCGQTLHGVETNEGGKAGAGTESGIPQNIAAPLSYFFAFISGLVLFFMDKRPFVRFHAAQSTIVFGILCAVGFASGRLAVSSQMSGQNTISIVYFAVFWVTGIMGLALWVVLIVKAFDAKLYRLPIVGRLADVMVGKAKA
jgi:uncharacterized membrane protein